jgi:hypothetical protein
MRFIAFALTTLSLSVLLPACGGKVAVDTGGGGGSTGPAPEVVCDLNANGVHVCAAYLSLPDGMKDSAISACTAGGGQILTACPTDGAIGTCALTMAGISVDEVFYAGGGITADAASSACTAANGTWTPA